MTSPQTDPVLSLCPIDSFRIAENGCPGCVFARIARERHMPAEQEQALERTLRFITRTLDYGEDWVKLLESDPDTMLRSLRNDQNALFKIDLDLYRASPEHPPTPMTVEQFVETARVGLAHLGKPPAMTNAYNRIYREIELNLGAALSILRGEDEPPQGHYRPDLPSLCPCSSSNEDSPPTDEEVADAPKLAAFRPDLQGE
jgi:hypothetical protein